MTPATALSALIDQLRAAGLVENPTHSPQGAGGLVDRGFSIREGGGKKVGGRSRADAAGINWRETMVVALTHVLPPGVGQSARIPAYQDLATAMRAINKPGTALTTEGAVKLGAVKRKTINDGALLSQVFTVEITFSFDMRTP